ncbi:efflux RND transporter periplasmic adaptor subunit [Dyella monticola]|uniref:Efflux RND transporter periplasmic adaptor subunit n=1 Tax=Dyella monticola TaxID=1927958 RepID=A0A370WUR4_9GAMM|nr:efflux RND transporter periplasmic adaptor subunit [Dyella monticola]RDS79715.1 efflux RND transporter periplasmic adaptor subunit [Dyella monticola]
MKILRALCTLLAIALLLLAVRALWIRYQVEPVTRDGKVLADIVPIAPDVAGLITDVRVHDNQMVRQGQVLLVIDPSRYTLALQQAQASLGSQRAALGEAMREDRRNRSMANVVASEVIEQGQTKVEQLRMAVAQAVAARDLAQLNLDRTQVKAPVSGEVTNVTLQPGIYLTVGKPALALVDTPSLRVEGYFEETKLQRIHVGDRVSVHLMGVPGEIRGHVDSIASAIEDRERSGDMSKPADVNPAFTWVRLAQRIPVRIAIDDVPKGTRLVPGQTATVVVHSPDKSPGLLPW